MSGFGMKIRDFLNIVDQQLLQYGARSQLKFRSLNMLADQLRNAAEHAIKVAFLMTEPALYAGTHFPVQPRAPFVFPLRVRFLEL